MPVQLMFNADVQPTAAPQLGKTELESEQTPETCDPQTSGFPVKTSELTVGSALRRRRCDAFCIDPRFPFQGRVDTRWQLDGAEASARWSLS